MTLINPSDDPTTWPLEPDAQPIGPQHVVGLGSAKQVGKDTLCAHLRSLDRRFHRFAFADRLREDLADLIRHRFGWDPNALTVEQKEITRPLLIAYGMAWRRIDPLHWVKVVIEQIDTLSSIHPDLIPVVTDVRFVNEATYLRRHYGEAFKLVQLNRVDAPPPTDEEERHWRDVAALADLTITWGRDDEESQLAIARQLCTDLNIVVNEEIPSIRA